MELQHDGYNIKSWLNTENFELEKYPHNGAIFFNLYNKSSFRLIFCPKLFFWFFFPITKTMIYYLNLKKIGRRNNSLS